MRFIGGWHKFGEGHLLKIEIDGRETIYDFLDDENKNRRKIIERVKKTTGFEIDGRKLAIELIFGLPYPKGRRFKEGAIYVGAHYRRRFITKTEFRFDAPLGCYVVALQ